mgnify:CR=1 FL=1
MTEIQQTNISVANFIIGALHKDKPFNLVLDAGETGALYHIASESHHLHSNFVRSHFHDEGTEGPVRLHGYQE